MHDWNHFKKSLLWFPKQRFGLDLSRVPFTPHYKESLQPKLEAAFKAMQALEAGAIANPDEKRQVGHYWLRAPQLAPQPEISQAITKTLEGIEAFAKKVHSGQLKGQEGAFEHFLVIGIGGSALGPQFVAKALSKGKNDCLKPHFIDNTDPEGIDAVLESLEGFLSKTLVVVISKSGSTPEPRNGMLEVANAYEDAGLDFAKHAVAVTGEGSQLDQYAAAKSWLARFPMWDWVGGRTSELSAVGLLPAALQGIDIRALLAGAAEMDSLTRVWDAPKNPAAQLALAWHFLTHGKGEKDMVILPYKDKLELFSRYLQQLVMESLGKAKDLDGQTVHQGIAVYGNKGSTDQHAYVQQLRDGVANFFATFIVALKDRNKPSIVVEDGMTCGDFLQGFFLGTRQALYENGRASISLIIENVTPYSLAQLIALFERAVGFYAQLVNINAYHQPGVEAGKKAASDILVLKRQIVAFFKQNPQKDLSAEALAAELKAPSTETCFWLLQSLASNGHLHSSEHPDWTQTVFRLG